MERLWEALSQRPADVPSPKWHGDAVRQGFAQLDEGSVVPAQMVFAKAEERIAAVERAQRA